MINSTAAEALGYTPDEIEQRSLGAFVAPAYAHRIKQYLSRVEHQGSTGGYMRLLTRQGAGVTWSYTSKRIENTAASSKVVVHAQDTTARLQREQKLRETNKIYRCLYEDAPVAYHEIDHRGVITNLNRAECELLGCDKKDVLGRHVWELVAPEYREKSKLSVLRKLAGEQRLVPFFREYVRHDGRRLLLHIHENEIRSRTGEIIGIRSTLLDVTEQHRAEAELRRLNAELDTRVAERTSELNESHDRMREFVYTVSHDLQEPLRSIGSFAKLLQDRYADQLDTEGLEFLQYVTSGTARMSLLVKDLLAYSHVLHEEPDTFEPVDLNEVVGLVVEVLDTSIKSTGAQVTHSDLPVVYANPNRLAQLFQNLLSNSIKYRGPDSPCIHVNATRSDSLWNISVADNGVGVGEADRERIFGLFKRSKGGVAPGSGVGLAICQAIVEKHGGRIWVEPAPGGGSIFSFTLPAQV